MPLLEGLRKRCTRHTATRIALLAVIFLYGGVRLLNLNAVVTTDEPFWLGRSGNFFRAIVVGDYEQTYQMAHPGVMTMWAGSIAYAIVFPEYVNEIQGNMNVPYGIERQLRDMGQNPLTLMVAAKVSKILIQTSFFAISVICLRKLLGDSTALIGSVLISFSPMTTGFDSALHVDGLFTTICFCATTLICWASFREMTVAP